MKLFYLLFVLMDADGVATTNQPVHLAKFNSHQDCIKYSIEQFDANLNWAIEIYCLKLPATNGLVTK